MTGTTLFDYLALEAQKLAEQPTLEEMRQRLAALPPVKLDLSIADIIHEERDKRSC